MDANELNRAFERKNLGTNLAKGKALFVPLGENHIVWTGSQNSCGYPQVSYRGKPRQVVRIIFESLHGPLYGKELHNTCGHKWCCNVDHWAVRPDYVEPAEAPAMRCSKCGGTDGKVKDMGRQWRFSCNECIRKYAAARRRGVPGGFAGSTAISKRKAAAIR